MARKKRIRKTKAQNSAATSKTTIPGIPVFLSMAAMVLVFLLGQRLYNFSSLTQAGNKGEPKGCTYNRVDISEIARNQCGKLNGGNVCLTINDEVDFSLECGDEADNFDIYSCNRCENFCDQTVGLCEEDIEY